MHALSKLTNLNSFKLAFITGDFSKITTLISSTVALKEQVKSQVYKHKKL